MRPGTLLVATPLLVDPNFARTVVYLFGDADGAAGVVLNRPMDLAVDDVLPGWGDAAAPPAVVHFGGPVALEHAVVLGVGAHPEMVTPEVGLVDPETEPGDLEPGSVRVFAGYAGWAATQLESEVAERSWFVVPGLASDVIDPEPATLWRRVLARQPGDLRRFSTYPDDPRLN